MPYFAKPNGEIGYHAEGAEPANREQLVEVDPPHDDPSKNTQMRYDHEADELVEDETPTGTVYERVLDQFIEWEGDMSSALDRLDSILSTRPTIEVALSQGNAEVLQDRLKRVRGDDLSKDEADQLIDLIQ